MIICLFPIICFSQVQVNLVAKDQYGFSVPYADLQLDDSFHLITREDGVVLVDLSLGKHMVRIESIGFKQETYDFTVTEKTKEQIILFETLDDLDEVVVSGTLAEISKSRSPVAITVLTPKFFSKNPEPSIYGMIDQVNGIRSQLNCNVCNTGDIHINGMEGAYTMITIDGMPIVGGLSTVYGLQGIPNSLIERVEVIKGPASTLYGSEVGRRPDQCDY